MPTFTRRRLLAVAGAAAAVLAAGACDPGATTRAPAAPPPSALPSSTQPPSTRSSSAPVLSREARFVPGAEEQTERGVYQRVITDKQLPPGETDPAEVTLVRIPGEAKLGPPSGDRENTVRTITVAGTTVRIDESRADPAGYHRQIEWITGGTHYVLLADAYTTRDDVLYGPTEDDLRWLIERVIRG